MSIRRADVAMSSAPFPKVRNTTSGVSESSSTSPNNSYISDIDSVFPSWRINIHSSPMAFLSVDYQESQEA